MRVLVYGFGGGLVGGVKKFLLSMNENMNDMVFDHVIDDTKCLRKDDIEALGGKVYMVAPRRKLFTNMRQWWKLLKSWKKENSDIVYFNVSSLNYTVPIWMARWLGYRVIVHAHSNSMQQSLPIYTLFHYVNRVFFRLLKTTLFTNSALSTVFMFGKSAKADLIYNAIEPETFRFNQQSRESIRAKYSIENKTVFGFVGRVEHPKNPLFLVDVFKIIHEKNPETALLIVGDGSAMEDVKKHIAEQHLEDAVILAGAQLDAPAFYSAMDVFLLPSQFEGLGIVLIEAQCNGLPCVASADVIPAEAKVTDALRFISLTKPAEEWADCALSLAAEKRDRDADEMTVADSHYNIKTEALILEEKIKHCR